MQGEDRGRAPRSLHAGHNSPAAEVMEQPDQAADRRLGNLDDHRLLQVRLQERFHPRQVGGSAADLDVQGLAESRLQLDLTGGPADLRFQHGPDRINEPVGILVELGRILRLTPEIPAPSHQGHRSISEEVLVEDAGRPVESLHLTHQGDLSNSDRPWCGARGGSGWRKGSGKQRVAIALVHCGAPSVLRLWIYSMTRKGLRRVSTSKTSIPSQRLRARARAAEKGEARNS